MGEAPLHIGETLGDFTTDRRVLSLSVLAVLIGICSAFIACGLLWLISFFTNVAFFGHFSAAPVVPAQSHFGAWMIPIPAIGGLIIGLMARYGSEKIRGHGIPEALEAILIGRSKIDAKVAILKPLSSALSIGTGGPFGAEGPIIMTGGAFGSLCAQFIHLSSAERKTLLVAGASGGMAAVFGTPVAAVLLAVESFLLFEWKPRSFIPVAFASIAAGVVRIPLLGAGPIFPVAQHPAVGVEGMGFALLVGLLAGLGSGLLTTMVYGFEDLFPRLKVHWMWWPAIGGLAVGVGGYIDPRVLGVGYGTIHQILNGQILGAAALGLLVAKAIVWSLSLGSGTSGGVLAPLLMMGGALGALVGQAIPVGSPALWAMVGMAGMMGGTMRCPFTAIVFTLELTHAVNALPALFLGCVASEVVTVLLMRRSILTEKVARRGHHLTREYSVDPFEIHRVREIMVSNFKALLGSMTIKEFNEQGLATDRWFVRRHAYALIDEHGHLSGMITQSDLMRAIELDDPSATLLDAGSNVPIVATEAELLRDAVTRMLSNGIGRLPVVAAPGSGVMIGYLDRSCIMNARMRWYEEENIRERHLHLTPRSMVDQPSAGA